LEDILNKNELMSFEKVQNNLKTTSDDQGEDIVIENGNFAWKKTTKPFIVSNNE
jgi:hypothetical protein